MRFKGKSTKISVSLTILALLAALCVTQVACNKKKYHEAEEETVNFHIKASQSKNYPVNSDSPLSASFAYANSIANTVQGFYTDGGRTHYALRNLDMSLVHKLDGFDNLNVTEIANAEGVSYANNTLDVYVKTSDGKMHYSGNSQSAGRMNTTRLGYYYYETHIRDLGFAEGTNTNVYQKETEIGLQDGWKINQMSTPQYKNGEMTVSAVNTQDPYVYKSNLSIPAEDFDAVEIEMKANGETSTAFLYFFTAETKNFNASQLTSFKIKSDGKYHKYLIDLTSAGLDGTALCGVRLDMGSGSGDCFTMKSVKAVKTGNTGVGYKLDKTFHVYSDKIHQEYRLVPLKNADPASCEYEEFGVELKIPKANVLQYKIEYAEDGVTPEYVAADVKNVGIIGFILPANNTVNTVSAAEEGDFLVIRQSVADSTFGSRIYNDETHDYNGIEKAAYEERNPLTKITASGNKKSKDQYLEYDTLRGAYRFTMRGTDFSTAYYNDPNGYYTSGISIENDGAEERSVYMWMNGNAGCLECAAVADSNGKVVPIPTQVCKNFQGEIEEPFYDPKDTAYGDSFIPLRIGAGQKLDYTLYHLYQNWGKFPLKQLSSIQFHISYYHLSTGVTESNCIAPYFVYGKDLWTLPDFRGCSGDIWAGQPQYNAVGRLRFVSYYKDGVKYASEYTDTEIRSSGTSYADLDYNYVSDCGSYQYTLRHIEFPQNDENRTYYSLRLDFLKDLTIEDVKNNLTLFSFDGRAEVFNLMSYTDSDGNRIAKNTDHTQDFEELLDIGKETPYFSYYGLNNKESTIMNFAYIMKNYDIVISGQQWNGNFALRNSFTGGLNLAELSLLEDTLTFKKGDHIYLNFILLPWGNGLSDTDKNVQYVIEDSVQSPLILSAVKGSVIEDEYLPQIRAEDGKAEFTLSGGRNRFAVRVDGMTSMDGIIVQEQKNGTWEEYVFHKKDFDGYQIIYNEDGTYSYVFIVEMDDHGSQRMFKVTEK
ncbi:MAG: hypothetical protein KIC77_10075 [Clostridiales bacterium]|nr:hypothetical protein [Clostridiales bacterium]